MSSIHASLRRSHSSKTHRQPSSLHMHSGIFFICVLSLICWGVQLLPVISVPLTGKGTKYKLHLSQNHNVTFGVFGVCDTVRHVCSSPRIGYTDEKSLVFPSGVVSSDSSSPFTTVQLPSNVTHLISKLLVLHVVAFGFTCLLLLQSSMILLADTMDEKYQPEALFVRLWSKLQSQNSSKDFSSSSRLVRGIEVGNSEVGNSEVMTEAKDTEARDIEAGKTKAGKTKSRKRDLRQLTLMFIFAILSFLSSLLAFLADFVLFVPSLGLLGWIQMLPVSLMAIIASLSCFLKRSILSRRHLHESVALADEMRSKRPVFVEWDDDPESEDGVFIYSNGFYNENKYEDGNTSVSIQSGLPIPRGSLDTEIQSSRTSNYSRTS